MQDVGFTGSMRLMLQRKAEKDVMLTKVLATCYLQVEARRRAKS